MNRDASSLYLESLELRREPPRRLESLLKDESKGEDGTCSVELVGIGIELDFGWCMC